MPASTDEANVSLTLDIAQVKAELGKLPGEGAKQAQKLVDNIEKEYKRLERAAKRAADRQKKDADDGYKSMAAGAKQAFTAIGGEAGAMAGRVDNAVRSIGTLAPSIGPVGLGALGAAAGVGVLTAGVVKLADVADDAYGRLEAAGKAKLVHPEDVAAVREYRQAVAELRTDVDLLKVSIGSGALDTLADLATAFDVLHDKVTEFLPEAGKVEQTIGGWRSIFGPASIFLGRMVDGLDRAVDAAGLDFVPTFRDDAARAADELAAEVEYLGKVALPPTTKELRDQAKAAKEHADRMDELVNGLGDVRELEKDLAAAHAKVANEQIAVIAAQREQREEVERIVEPLEEAAAAVQDLQAHWGEITKDRDIAFFFERQGQQLEGLAGQALDFAATMTDAYLQVTDAITDAMADATNRELDALEEVAERQIENAERAADKWRENQIERLEGELEAGAVSEKLALQREREIEEEYAHRKENANRRAADERKLAKELFDQQQDVAKAMIVVHAAAGVLKSIATLGPPIPPNFVGMAGVAAVGAAAISEGAAIRNAQPPSFERGGMVGDRATGLPDHILIAATRAEAVLDTQGVDTAGGRAGVDRLNDGIPIGGNTVMQVVLGRRVVAEVIADRMGRGRPDPRRGRRDPNRGGR